MAPIQLDFNNERYKTDIIPSKVVEVIAVIHLLANRSKYDFASEFVDSLYGRLSEKSRNFLLLISELNFSGAEFFGFLLHEGIHNDFDVLASKMSTYSDIDFIYLALDRDISREQIESARNSEEMFNKMRSDLCCNLWRGGEAPIRALVYDTKRYRDGLLSLAREVCLDAEFNRTIESLTPLYKKSAEDIRQKLVKTPPLELASEIKGKNVADNQSFKQYYFIPSYFLHDFNISAWEAETSIFMLFYSVKTSERIDHEEIDRFLSLLKSLSDRTRLQILQKLRTAPSYGKKLAEELNLSTASISRQLDQLRTMKLITEEKSDNFKYFRINRNEIDQLIKSIQEFFSEE